MAGIIRLKAFLLIMIFFSLGQPARAEEPVLHCFGTEPFWVASVYQDRMTFTILGQESIVIAGELLTPVGVSAQYAQNFNSDSVILTTVNAHCNDGMSDRTYPRIGLVQFITDKKIGLVGCCQPQSISRESE